MVLQLLKAFLGVCKNLLRQLLSMGSVHIQIFPEPCNLCLKLGYYVSFP